MKIKRILDIYMMLVITIILAPEVISMLSYYLIQNTSFDLFISGLLITYICSTFLSLIVWWILFSEQVE
jgi:hypothetical protein